jgi:hypothetical protein
MYKLTYRDEHIKSRLLKDSKFWDSELSQEVSAVLDTLKKSGEIEGAICGVQPGIFGMLYELKGRTFQMNYTVDTTNKNIKIHEFKLMFHEIDWKTTLEQKIHENDDQPCCIPQIGDPYKLLKTIDLIHSGINTSKELGIESGSGAKKDKDLARRGEYLTQLIIEIGLVKRHLTEKKHVYILTDNGKRIANSQNTETRERLLVEALLGFRPIQMIIEATTHDNKELTLELIQDIITQVSLDDCGGTTNPRRAHSLRALVNWIARWAGIPILRKGGVQLYIPDFYSVSRVK